MIGSLQLDSKYGATALDTINARMLFKYEKESPYYLTETNELSSCPSIFQKTSLEVKKHFCWHIAKPKDGRETNYFIFYPTQLKNNDDFPVSPLGLENSLEKVFSWWQKNQKQYPNSEFLIPLAIGDHWVTLHISGLNTQKITARLYDSHAGSWQLWGVFKQGYYNQTNEIINKIFKKLDLDYETVRCSHQSDDYNCGAWAVAYIGEIIEGNLPSSQSNIVLDKAGQINMFKKPLDNKESVKVNFGNDIFVDQNQNKIQIIDSIGAGLILGLLAVAIVFFTGGAGSPLIVGLGLGFLKSLSLGLLLGSVGGAVCLVTSFLGILVNGISNIKTTNISNERNSNEKKGGDGEDDVSSHQVAAVGEGLVGSISSFEIISDFFGKNNQVASTKPTPPSKPLVNNGEGSEVNHDSMGWNLV